jgi:hypothetical protein
MTAHLPTEYLLGSKPRSRCYDAMALLQRYAPAKNLFLTVSFHPRNVAQKRSDLGTSRANTGA